MTGFQNLQKQLPNLVLRLKHTDTKSEFSRFSKSTSNTYSFLVVCYGLWLDSMIDVSIGTKNNSSRNFKRPIS